MVQPTTGFYRLLQENIRQCARRVQAVDKTRLTLETARFLGKRTAEWRRFIQNGGLGTSSRNSHSGGKSRSSVKETGYSRRRFIADLSLFGLRPPASLEAVRRARNREIKRCHCDRFVNDPQKYAAAKEVMQIYNAAYDRLTAYYKQTVS